MKICYVTTDSLAEGVGQSQILPLLEGLRSKGHEVSIVSFEKHSSEDIKQALNQSGVLWVSLHFGRRGVLGGFGRIIRLVRSIPRADVYHARSDIPALCLILAGKKPFLWDVRSLWMEQKKIVGGETSSLKLIARIWKYVERFIAHRGNAINTLASALYPILEERAKTLPELRSVIPTCVDTKQFQLSLDVLPKKRILLSGTLNNFYDISRTREFITFAIAAGYQVRWCRPSESDNKSLQILGLEVREIKHSKMAEEISESSFGIAICKEDAGISLKGVMPTKVAEFLATGRPVVISQGMGDLDQLVKEHRVGVIASSGKSFQRVIQEIEVLLQDPLTPQRCRDLAEQHFSMKEAIVKYENIYFKMLNAKN